MHKLMILLAGCALALVSIIPGSAPVEATPDTTKVATHVDWNPAPDICSWLRAVWFPGWAKWSSSNQSPFNDPVVQCIYYRVTGTVEFACVWYRRLDAHQTIRIHPPDPCLDLVSFAFP